MTGGEMNSENERRVQNEMKVQWRWGWNESRHAMKITTKWITEWNEMKMITSMQ